MERQASSVYGNFHTHVVACSPGELIPGRNIGASIIGRSPYYFLRAENLTALKSSGPVKQVYDIHPANEELRASVHMEHDLWPATLPSMVIWAKTPAAECPMDSNHHQKPSHQDQTLSSTIRSTRIAAFSMLPIFAHQDFCAAH